MSLDVELIVKQNAVLNGQNADWRSYWDDLAAFCLPRKAWITSPRTEGERLKLSYLYDSTAIRSLKIMSAGFHSNLTNPATKWFALQTRDQSLMKDRAVQLWFKTVTDTMYSVIGASNFDNVMQEFYMDGGCFGTGTIFTDEDSVDTVRYRCIPLEQTNIVEDYHERIIEFYRPFKLQAIQADRLWGQDAGEVVADAIKDNKPFTELEFLHYVGPRHARDVQKSDGKNLPFASAWIAIKGMHLIYESGYQEFPYAVGRFYKSYTSPFGDSPAADAFADIKGINFQKRVLLRAAAKIADPPLLSPSRGFVLPINLNPAAMNYYDAKQTKHDALQPIQQAGNLPITVEVMKMTQEDIEQTFFVPLFRSISDINKQMTVPEVQRRIAENMVLLGPVVGRFTHEVLSPVVLRTFYILERQGLFPIPPESIQEQEMDVVYLSPLAKSQRQTDMTSITSWLSVVGQIAAVKPDALDIVDEDKTVRELADIQGVDPELLRDPKVVAQLRQQRQDQLAKQQQMAMLEQGTKSLQQGAQAGKHLAEAVKTE